MRKYVSDETIMCGNKDQPWFNNKTRTLIQEKNILYRIFRTKY